MSYRLACELSTRIAAIAPVACSMSLPSCQPERPVPVIHFHSYQDGSVPFGGGIGSGISDHYNTPIDSVALSFANQNECGVRNDTVIDNGEYTHIQWRDCRCAAEVNQYITYDGGHSWPGGKQTPIGDPVSEVLVANNLMWEFFEKHTLVCNSTTGATDQRLDPEKPIVYPMPTNGYLNIEWPGKTNGHFILFDAFGFQIQKGSQVNEINIGNLASGIYFLLLTSKGNQYVEKIIKN